MSADARQNRLRHMLPGIGGGDIARRVRSLEIPVEMDGVFVGEGVIVIRRHMMTVAVGCTVNQTRDRRVAVGPFGPVLVKSDFSGS